MFTANFDYVYYTRAALRLEGVQQLLPEQQMAELLAGDHAAERGPPFDHFPAGVVLAFE